MILASSTGNCLVGRLIQGKEISMAIECPNFFDRKQNELIMEDGEN